VSVKRLVEKQFATICQNPLKLCHHSRSKTQSDNYGKLIGDSDYPNLNRLKQALTEQLGLELVPGTAPIKMLVVEKSN
jgi:uncharacterized protein (TIGR03435 family)